MWAHGGGQRARDMARRSGIDSGILDFAQQGWGRQS